MDAFVLELARHRAATCKALASARRLVIVWLLSEGELSVGEIARRAGTTLQNASQHLKRLRISGLVAARRDGHTIYYRIANQDWVRQFPAILQTPESMRRKRP
jgi:DNA-binding transcriptional ArsR family regulator